MSRTNETAEEQKFMGEIQLARLELTKAENNLEAVRERARVAKRRRKEAKVAARHARKEVKRAKNALAEAKQILVLAEAKLASVGKQRVQRPAQSRQRRQTRKPRSLPRKVRHPTQTRGNRPVLTRRTAVASNELGQQVPIRLAPESATEQIFTDTVKSPEIDNTGL